MALDGEHLLREVSERIHLPLKLDPQTRRCVLQDRTADQKYFLELPVKSPQIYLYTILRPYGGEQDNPEFLRALLQLNLFGLQTNTCTLSIDANTKNINMHLAFPIEFLSPPLLINLITNFIVTTRKMSGKIETLLLTADQALRRKRTTFSAAEVMDKKKPDSSIRILRI